MDGVAYLIHTIYKKDSLAQLIPDGEERIEVLVTENSVSRREWTDAGRNGFKSEFELTTAAINYSGEKEIEYNGVRYAIYRTHKNDETDEMELYLQKKAGVQNGND